MMTVTPCLTLLEQHLLDLAGRAGVEAGERFVENDEVRVVHQGAGERHLLQHALGEAAAALMGMRAEAEPLDQLAWRGLCGAVGIDCQRPATNSRYSSGVSRS